MTSAARCRSSLRHACARARLRQRAIGGLEIRMHDRQHAAVVERESREAQPVAQGHALLERGKRGHHAAFGVQHVRESRQRLRLAFGVARRARVGKRLLLRRLRGDGVAARELQTARASKPRATTRAADAPRAPATPRARGHRAPHPPLRSRGAPRRCRCTHCSVARRFAACASARSKAEIEPVTSPVSRARSPSKRARSCRTSSVDGSSPPRRASRSAASKRNADSLASRGREIRRRLRDGSSARSRCSACSVASRAAIPRRGTQVQRAAVTVAAATHRRRRESGRARSRSGERRSSSARTRSRPRSVPAS